MDHIELFQATVSGLFPVFLVSLTGLYLAYKGIFKQDSISKFSLSFINHFCPMFIFAKMTRIESIFDLKLFWPLIISPLLMLVIGAIASFLHSSLITQPPNFSRVSLCIFSFPTTGNTSIVLMKGACSPYGPLHDNPYCEHAYAYVGLQLILYSTLIWTYGYVLILKEKTLFQTDMEESKLLQEGAAMKGSPPFSILRSACKQMTSPVSLSVYLALIAGAIPGLREAFYSIEDLIYALTEAFIQIGTTGIFFAQIMLGSSLWFLPSRADDITKRYIASVILFKYILIPLLALGVVYGLWESEIFGDDIVMCYTIFIILCSPSNLVILSINI